MLRTKLVFATILTCLLCSSIVSRAQLNWDPFGKDQKKPPQYEEKQLASEKTDEKKFGPVRRAIQNTTSHYNFYFNANNKLNAVIERARLSNKDDYSRLLSFYSYSLDNTASQKTDLDSVIYKATAGILLHDLRTEWVDNFYLLIGEAYYLKKDLDSAALTFQFINYNLFPHKKSDDGYGKVIGTNDAGTGTGSVSIADREKRNIFQKAFTQPPSRNDALIWQIRTFIQQGEYGDAAGLISILQNDKNLPARLKNDLEEVTSYWFYAQNNYDSSATHLAKALSNADTKEDKSRWEYLLAQMYELSGHYDLASEYFNKAAKHTSDPVMDIYARLNDATMQRNSGNVKELNSSIENLLKMAHRDRYESYRDIIYYSAARLTLQRPDTSIGLTYYSKSIVYNNPTSGYRDKSYLQLANIAYTQGRYKDARSFYDSINISGKETDFDPKLISDRKEILGRLIPLVTAIEREDSLQMIASLSPSEREAFIKRIIRNYRKSHGLKGDADNDFAGNTLITFNDHNKTPEPLFPASGAATGEWYFYNATLKSRGFNDFKSKWGKRENVDNWRRKTATEAAIGQERYSNADPDAATTPEDVKKGQAAAQFPTDAQKIDEYAYDAMMGNIPMTAALIDSSNGTVSANMFAAALIFQNELEDYSQAIAYFENFIQRFPQDVKIPDAYFNLSYCYSKIGNTSKADYYKNLLRTNYASSKAAKTMANPAAINIAGKSPEVTAKYSDIYNMFIEGNFEQAIAAKRSADSVYGKNYWSPQLLYIEAVYYIKQRQDSNAIAVLRNIQSLYPGSPLKAKATTMIDVLGRRAQIEKYLTDLQVTRAEDDKVIVPDDDKAPAAVAAPVIKPVDTKITAPVIPKKVISDSIKIPDAFVNKSFVLRPEQPHYVVMILDKVDGVYVNEAKNAFTRFDKESSETSGIVINKDALDADKALLVFTPFENAAAALKYFDRIKKAAPSEVSWLQASKYSFIIISEANLTLLKTNKDISSYKQLINTNFGNRF